MTLPTASPLVVCLGAHILDILGRPVTAIPPGQGSVLLEEIRLTAAGTAAGTAVDLAKLGARVVSMGAIGDDNIGGMLVSLLDARGVDTSRLARIPGSQTSATMLPIRPNGERPALHVPGATPHLRPGDVDLGVIATADVLHVGGPDVLGRFAGEPLAAVLAAARAGGTLVTMDLLRPVPRRSSTGWRRCWGSWTGSCRTPTSCWRSRRPRTWTARSRRSWTRAPERWR